MRIDNGFLGLGIALFSVAAVLRFSGSANEPVNHGTFLAFTGPTVLPQTAGAPLVLDTIADDVVLFVFRTDCPWSAVSIPHIIAQLHDPLALDGEPRSRVVAVSSSPLEEAEAFLRLRGLDAIVFPLDAETRSRWGLESVPTTLVVGPGGEVKWAHVGVLSEAPLSEIRTVMR